jgi:hypothetical protein
MMSSIRLDGSTACMALEGTTDTESFHAYVGQGLVPTLRPGDIVVMDNLSPHKSDATLALITHAGAQVLFLPAYSPDLNPIDHRHRPSPGQNNAPRRPGLVYLVRLQFLLKCSKGIRVRLPI